MHSARLLPVSPSMHCAGGRCLLPREGGSVSASQGAVCFGGGSASGGMSASLLPGGVSVGGGRGVYPIMH